LSGIGVACDVVAPSLIPVRAGDRIKTDRRDAKKLKLLGVSSARFCCTWSMTEMLAGYSLAIQR
jgi:transposase